MIGPATPLEGAGNEDVPATVGVTEDPWLKDEYTVAAGIRCLLPPLARLGDDVKLSPRSPPPAGPTGLNTLPMAARL